MLLWLAILSAPTMAIGRMATLFGEFVTRRWLATILLWVALLALVRATAPDWDTVTCDGDLAYLPAWSPSLVGQRLTEAAFPGNRAKSQVVLIVAREGEALQPADAKVADELAQRFQLLHGAANADFGRQRLRAADELQKSGKGAAADAARQQGRAALQSALDSFEEAIRLHEPAAVARHDRAIVRRWLGQNASADEDRAVAWKEQPDLRQWPDTVLPADAGDVPLVDVWTRHNEVFGRKLKSRDRQALLVILQLSSEFMATQNIRTLTRIEAEVDAIRQKLSRQGPAGLTIGISGSAAVGGDMLRCAAESIRNTEVLTVVLVVAILLVVYRAPLLVLVPLLTIFLALTFSTGILALLAQWSATAGHEWLEFRVFKTTRIFIVVILYGSGTDFCLFLIARYRELLESGEARRVALARGVASVRGAVAGSALTTILGLGMMFFADFGKFRNSGPAIGLCLAITLVACLTLAPALLSALGAAAFWPGTVSTAARLPGDAGPSKSRSGGSPRFTSPWRWLSRLIVLYPGRLLALGLLLLTPLAVWGWSSGDRVTFDLLNELPRDQPSRVGTEMLRRHFAVGEGGPIVVLARKKNAGFDDPDPSVSARALAAISDLTGALRAIPGVEAVRSLAEPLGDPPRRMSLVSPEGRRKLLLRQHRLTRSIFVAESPAHRGQVTRFEVVLRHDPFSIEATRMLASIDAFLRRQSQAKDSFWYEADFTYTGTTAGIRDLREVTTSDGRRIRVLVVAAVFCVLWVLLRRPLVCLYLTASVVFSYLVTIGFSEWFFARMYAETFLGLDWKVPIFLFVILVAVGEDYNIYLVTRVFQEQGLRGPFSGLREAIVRTGGVITSCGAIMAGTFVAMTSGTLRAVVELGFALSLGVLLDTMVVRTLLVPAFLALLAYGRPRKRVTTSHSKDES